jgi:hypothetical protein
MLFSFMWSWEGGEESERAEERIMKHMSWREGEFEIWNWFQNTMSAEKQIVFFTKMVFLGRCKRKENIVLDKRSKPTWLVKTTVQACFWSMVLFCLASSSCKKWNGLPWAEFGWIALFWPSLSIYERRENWFKKFPKEVWFLEFSTHRT